MRSDCALGPRLRQLVVVGAVALAAALSGVGAPLARAADDASTTIDDGAVGPGTDSVAYAGAWRADGSNGSVRASAERGSSLVVRFEGSAISLYKGRTRHHGLAA